MQKVNYFNMKNSEEIQIPSVRNIQMLLEPIYERLSNIEASLKSQKEKK